MSSGLWCLYLQKVDQTHPSGCGSCFRSPGCQGPGVGASEPFLRENILSRQGCVQAPAPRTDKFWLLGSSWMLTECSSHQTFSQALGTQLNKILPWTLGTLECGEDDRQGYRLE